MTRLSSWATWLKRATFNPRAWLLFVSLQVPALRALCKYLPDWLLFAIPVFLGVVFLIYAVSLRCQSSLLSRAHVLGSVWTLVVLLVIVIVINYLVYPIADGLEAQMRGSDQDDALIQAGQRLVSGLNPYEASTYRGNPISPGPGWVILALPFCIPGIYFLMTPLFILGAAFLLRVLGGSFYRSNLFVFLLMSSLAFWEVMVVGSDMLAIGLLFLGCVVLVYFKWEQSIFWTVACVVLVSFAATARVIFVYLIPLIGVFLWRRGYVTALKFAALSGFMCAAIHVLFYYWNPQSYTPLHLLGKGEALLPTGLMIPAVLACAAAALYTTLKSRDRLDRWVFLLWLCLLIPLAVLSLGGLISRSYDFASWEEANYLMVVAPVCVFYVCLVHDS